MITDICLMKNMNTFWIWSHHWCTFYNGESTCYIRIMNCYDPQCSMRRYELICLQPMKISWLNNAKWYIWSTVMFMKYRDDCCSAFDTQGLLFKICLWYILHTINNSPLCFWYIWYTLTWYFSNTTFLIHNISLT